MIEQSNKRKYIIISSLFLTAAIAGGCLFLADYFNMFAQKSYTANDFNITTLKSDIDFNTNGIDDYSDILIGARKDAENHPAYDASYFNGGFPPENKGVCTDVVWRALRNAGYNLREMVDNDIKHYPQDYKEIKNRDKNIDFRRVGNLHIFFQKYSVSLTADTSKFEQWQPGDIVIFGDDNHIGIVSDKRTKNGVAYVIHNENQPQREEDYFKRRSPSYHFRFDSSLVSKEVLAKWE